MKLGAEMAAMTLMVFALAGAVSAAPRVVVYDTRAGKQLQEKALWKRLATADAVFVGERHNDPQTHVFERRALEELAKRAKTPPTLALEMFERDVQTVMDDYLAGRSDEAAFLKDSRPWPNYATDYRPLIEFAKAHKLQIVASNVPRPLASKVGKEGLAAVKDTLSPLLVLAPHDDYWQRFSATMAGMSETHGGAKMDADTIARFYEAQVLKDEMMADSIVAALDRSPGTTVYHVNGQFHSDYGGGIPRRVLWRRPLARVVVVSVIPVAAGEKPPALEKTLADYVVFVPETTPGQVK